MELINNRYTLARGSLPTRLLLNALSDLSNGSLDVEIDGRVEHFEGNNTGPAGHIQIDHPARLLQRIVTGGSIGFAEGFMRGDWHSEDLMERMNYPER